jgi:hypothetical protein
MESFWLFTMRHAQRRVIGASLCLAISIAIRRVPARGPVDLLWTLGSGMCAWRMFSSNVFRGMTDVNRGAHDLAWLPPVHLAFAAHKHNGADLDFYN